MSRHILVILVSAGFLSACATTQPEFCDARNWQDIGYQDAMAGKEDNALEARNDCATDDAPLAYRLGFDYGLSKYCTFKRGLFTGEHGQAPVESCATEKWDEYQNGYLMGRELYQTNQTLESISQQLVETRSTLWDLRKNNNDPGIAAQIQQLEATLSALLERRNRESKRLLALRADAQGL